MMKFLCLSEAEAGLFWGLGEQNEGTIRPMNAQPRPRTDAGEPGGDGRSHFAPLRRQSRLGSPEIVEMPRLFNRSRTRGKAHSRGLKEGAAGKEGLLPSSRWGAARKAARRLARRAKALTPCFWTSMPPPDVRWDLNPPARGLRQTNFLATGPDHSTGRAGDARRGTASKGLGPRGAETGLPSSSRSHSPSCWARFAGPLLRRQIFDRRETRHAGPEDLEAGTSCPRAA